ncbi:telomere repeat-binding protein 2-like [Impatiens glandulifera]|uniref:telomere repeat-binding protein 2-like n=1 Tax=Impatiens glandulifera TaxID=253017 RepID=UPI001FB04E95|nr:telomere repeat-binding protein 2-like [Impatiens glandulifera]
MMLNKRLNYESRGYQLPFIPRAPRSIRRRTSQKKKLEDGQICAFELLATVAGEMLLECESSASSFESVKAKQEDSKLGRPEYLDQTSCIESGSVEQKSRKGNTEKISSVIPSAVSPEPSNKAVNYLKLETLKSQVGSSRCYSDAQLGEGTIVNVIKKEHNTKDNSKPDFILGGTSVNNSPLVNSSSNVQFPSCFDHVPNASFLKQGNHVKAGRRDDDENSVGCNGRSVKPRIFRPHSRFGYRRIRRLLTSKYWKVAPKLKDCDFSLTNKVLKPISANWNTNMNVRSKLEGPSRKRKFYDHRYECEGSSESLSNSTEKSMKRSRNNGSQIASGPSAVVRSHQPSFQKRDSHVKLSIKSFRVPDLYIDVPETATVGSLKMKVMEAVSAILEDGLHVGVLLQGKKVRDDNRTLLQSGICGNGDLDALGFILEPLSSSLAPSSVSPKDPPPVLVPCGTTHHEISNAAITQEDDKQKKVLSSSSSSSVIDEVKKIEVCEDSKSLVPVVAAEMGMMEEALDITPINQKLARRSEIVQPRRTRRPFTVTEVESLVEAVEKLGTGRWRDVKMSAFEYAEYRTYVDLKDKWKTLVHTASISPQQRRGEPVPQELLDRVQAAHAYWSLNQSRPHIIKNQQHFIVET